MVDGIMSDVFSMSTLPLSQPEQSQELKDKIRAQSRQRYSMERGKLEELIKIWSNKTFSPVEKAMQKAMEAATQDGGAVAKPQTPQPSKPVEPLKDVTVRAEVINQKNLSSAQKQETKQEIEQATPLQETQPSGFDPSVTVNELGVPVMAKANFSIDDIKLGDWYDGFVKLKYNYGLFVTVK